MDALATEQIQDQRGKKRRAGGEDRAAQGLVDRLVDHLRRDVRTLATQFTESVEDHDRVVDRKADNRQERGHHVEADLEVINQRPAKEAAQVGAEGEAGHRHQHVVDERHDGCKAEGDVLEPHPHVEHDHQQARQHRVDRGDLRVASHLATDRVGREIDRGVGEFLRHPLHHPPCRLHVERRGDRPVAVGLGTARGSLRLGRVRLQFEGRVGHTLGLQGVLDGRPQRGPVDLLGKVEGHGRRERPGLGSRLVGPGRRCDLAKAHRIGGQPARKHLLKRLLDLIVAAHRGVDLITRAGGDIGGGHGAHRRVGEHGDGLPHLGDIERLVGLECHLHARATGEVDVEQPLATLRGGGHAQQNEGQRTDDGGLHPADELEVGLSEEPGHRQLPQPTVPLGEIEGHPGTIHRREQVQHQPEDQRDGEALQLVCAHRKQHHGRNERREIRVDDRRERPLEPVANRHADGCPAIRLLPHALVDEHVGIDRHAHGEHEAGQAGERERRLERDHQRNDEQDIEQHRQVGHEP